jgi:ribosome-binding ATPase YchF (GTP1/OBG family)
VRELDSLSEERRLVLLAINKMYYLNYDNQKLSRENQALTKINERNVLYIAQIERDLSDIKDINKGLNEGLNEELKRKKKWRKATLLIGSIYVFTAAIIYLQ